MTIGTVILIVVIVGVLFMIMKKGGGCCGGHSEHEQSGHNQNAPSEHAHCEMDHHKWHVEPVAETKDPVCGMSVKDDSISHEHEGKTYSFCSEHCKEKFVAGPGEFVQ